MTEAAIPAATLIVWRDPPAASGGDPVILPPLILVVERSATMAFAGGAIVFPGGRMDPQDYELAAALGLPGEAAKVTAIRETIEESAVAAGLAGTIDPALGLVLQQALIDGAPFAGLLATHGLTLDLDALVPFARWMPAFKHARKFDTMFYLVPALAGDWPPRPQPGECVAAEWDSPKRLLARIDSGDAAAIFPTKRNLERLAQHAGLDAALADAHAHSIDTITPWIEEVDGEPHVCIPPDRGYPVISEPLATAFRG